MPESRSDGEAWHAWTLDMWRDLQTSPMHSEYARVDFHLALAFALAFDVTIRKPGTPNLTKLTVFVEHFGLSPRSRRSLQWEIKRAEEKVVKAPVHQRDPRLRSVS